MVQYKLAAPAHQLHALLKTLGHPQQLAERKRLVQPHIHRITSLGSSQPLRLKLPQKPPHLPRPILRRTLPSTNSAYPLNRPEQSFRSSGRDSPCNNIGPSSMGNRGRWFFPGFRDNACYAFKTRNSPRHSAGAPQISSAPQIRTRHTFASARLIAACCSRSLSPRSGRVPFPSLPSGIR